MAKIETLDVPDITVSEARRARVLKKIMKKSTIHSPNKDVQSEIEKRIRDFMQKEELVEHTFDPMNPTE